MRNRLFTLSIAMLISASMLHAAQKLKGVYSGSGGIAAEVHRVLMVEFGEDGTAILQQSWAGKDPQIWHARWVQEGNEIRIAFDPVKDQAAVDPLVCKLKHGTLVPTSWDAKALGVLGPPQLMPFGGRNIKQHSVGSCQSLNTLNPTYNCTTWDSRDK
jgi:hypothetical protein